MIFYLSQHRNVFLKMTVLHIREFDELVGDVRPAFSEAEAARLQRANRQREIGGGRDSELDARNQILLTVWGLWGYLFGVSDSTVSRVIGRLLPLLEQAGRDTLRLPQLLEDRPGLAVVIDSFEQKVQRPKAKEEGDGWYSHKKRSHTTKSPLAVDEESGRIVDVSASVTGRTHDLTLLKQSRWLERLPPGVGGLGYQGIRDLHPLAAWPRKKPWGKDKPRPPKMSLTTAPSPNAGLLLRTASIACVVIKPCPRPTASIAGSMSAGSVPLLAWLSVNLPIGCLHDPPPWGWGILPYPLILKVI